MSTYSGLMGDFTSPNINKTKNPGVSFLMPTFSNNAESDNAILNTMTNPGEGMGWLASTWDGLGKYWNNSNNIFGKQSMFGGKDPLTGKEVSGWLPGAATAAASLGNLYGGLEMLDLQKDSYKTQKNLANVNIENQVKLANADLGQQYLRSAYARGLSGDAADQFANERLAQTGLQVRTV